MKFAVSVLLLFTLFGCAAKRPKMEPQHAVIDVHECTKLYSVAKNITCTPVPNTTKMVCDGQFVMDVLCYRLVTGKEKPK